MSNLRFTHTNAGDDSTGRVFGLDGNLYLPVILSLVTGVVLFAALGFTGLGYPLAGAVAIMPVAGSLSWVWTLRHGKPPGYDRDKVDDLLGGADFSRGSFARTDTRPSISAPDGRFVHDMLVFGSLESGGPVAKGFRLECPDLRGASFERLNAFQDQIKSVLALLSPGRRLQVQWWVDADYRKALLQYHARTQSVEDSGIRACRNERFTRYWHRIANGGLRREHLVVFLSIETNSAATPLRSRKGLVEHYSSVLEELSSQFDEFAATLRTVFGPEAPVHPLGDVEHFALIRRFLNPSLANRTDDDHVQLFDPELTLQESCWHCDGVGQKQGGFVLDGQHHAILTLSRWPQRTRPGIVTHLTGLPFLDYCLSVNITPIAGRTEIQQEEKAAERLRGEYAEKPRASLLIALRKKERKVEALAGGFAKPFHVTYVIRVWAPTSEALREKVAAVQAAVNAMDGAQCLECALPTTAKKLFFASWPGWTHSSYHHRELYAEDAYLADILPFSATFTGTLDQAEALYDGSHGNLVGLSTAANGSPQHAVLLGMTGAGKSAFVEDLLFQTADHFAHTLLIEEGLSYQRFTEAMGEKPIILHPDAAFTLNYFDTQGLPLSQLHLATAVALLSRMIGTSEDAEKLALRQAQLTQYLHQLYRDTFADFARLEPEKAEKIRRFACAAHGWRAQLPEGTTPLEVFGDLRDRTEAKDDQALEYLDGLTEEEITHFAQDPTTERFVAQTACAFYTPADFPTHSALVELLAYARFPEHDQAEIDMLATLLRAWTVDGQYGRLFDGTTNISFRKRIVHIELGLIPEQAVQMKAAAGLLISGLGRQHILSLPRASRKRILFEELSRFLDTPGGEQIVVEGYAQLRKHNCWCASIVQQYSRFRASRIRGAVIGNAKQFFLMRQNDRADLRDLAQDIPLPETAVDAIQRYPLPEQLPAEQRHSSVCVFTPTTQPPQCGTLRHFREEPCASAA